MTVTPTASPATGRPATGSAATTPAQAAVPEAGQRPVELAWGPSPHARRLLTAGLAGLIIAVAARRPEFAAAAAPALLLLAGWRRERPQRIWVSAVLSTRQVVEQEPIAAEVTVAGTAGYSVSLRIHPAPSVEPRPGGASPDGASPNGASPEDAGPAQTGLPFEVTRWGRRRVGVLEIVLRDRWRLSEGRATVPLPRVDCHPQAGPAEHPRRAQQTAQPAG